MDNLDETHFVINVDNDRTLSFRDHSTGNTSM